MERLISKDTELKIILVICGIIWVSIIVKMILDGVQHTGGV
jgi:small neutral amino acid transporter SnatA (MarC family)